MGTHLWDKVFKINIVLHLNIKQLQDLQIPVLNTVGNDGSNCFVRPSKQDNKQRFLAE